MKRNYIALAAIALIALPAGAQQKQQTQAKDSTVNRTVVVEQEYNPDILDASKINVLPKVEAPSVSKKEVEYATSWSPANKIPIGTIQPYTGKEVPKSSLPGYARLGYGNYGNLDILANYLFRLTDKDRLNLNFKMDGMNGELTLPHHATGEEGSWDAHYYRTRANVDYTHQFTKLDLNVAGNFGVSNFNLPPGNVGKQKFTSGDVHFGVKSTDETLPLQFRAETNLLLYGRQQNGYNATIEGIDETTIRTKGVVTGAINDESLIAIALQMDNLFYKEKANTHGNRVFDNRTLLHLNPHYELNNDSWLLHLGANVDFSLGGGKALRVSPNVTAQYLFSDSYILYAKATGGRQTNDLRQLEQLNPYAICTTPIMDTYEQLNTRIGFKSSPTPGLWFNLYGGYQNLKDDLYLDKESLIGTGAIKSYLEFQNINTDNFYVGGEVSYAYKELFSISAEATYYRWDSNYSDQTGVPLSNDPSLLMKPKFNFDLRAELHPISALRLNVGYQYQSRALSQISGAKREVADVSNLSLGGSYNLFKGISIYAQLNNLLNKKYQWYYTIPTEGLNFMGGLSFQF